MDLSFLSEPVTKEVAEEAAYGAGAAPDGTYTMRITSFRGRLSSQKQTPMFQINFAHTGEIARKKGATLTLFNNDIGRRQLAELAVACGISPEDASGLQFGWGQEMDEYGRYLGYVVDVTGSPVSELFFGKDVVAVLKSDTLEDGKSYQKVKYIKVMKQKKSE